MNRVLPAIVLATACSLDTQGVNNPPRPPDAVDVVMQFCDDLPAWFAYKNDGYAWVGGAVGFGRQEFSFPARAKVTVVTGTGFSTANTAFSRVTVRNMTAEEANDFRCRLTPIGLSSMTGLVRTEGSEDLSVVQLGDAFDVTTGNQPFVMSRLGPGTLDLVAINRLFDTATARVIIRNAITVANGAAIPTLDFASAEAKPMATVRVRHDGGQPALGFVLFETSRKSRVALPVPAFGLGDSVMVSVIPASLIRSGDLHRIDIESGGRGLTYWQSTPVDTTITFGPLLGALTIDTIIATPVLRPRVRFASQSPYPAMAEVTFSQTTATVSRSIQVITTAGFLDGTPAEWEIALPDLRGIIPDPWVLLAGSSTTFSVTARNARPALFNGIVAPTAGETMRFATKLAP